MAFSEEIAQRARDIAAPLLATCLVVYIGFHAIQGERGLVTWLQLSQQIEQTRTALALSRGDERKLAHRVALMRGDGLDPDLLDERARDVLNLAHPDDLVIFNERISPRF